MSRRDWAARVAAAALVVFCIVAAFGQAALVRVETRWPTMAGETMRRSAGEMQRTLSALASDLRRDAEAALRAPAEPRAAFAALAALPSGVGDRGVVLVRGGRPAAWSGRVWLPLDSSAAPYAVIRSPFYVAIQATVAQGRERAVATALVHAEPPADRLAHPLDEAVAARAGVDGFALVLPSAGVAPDSAEATAAFAPGGLPLLTMRAVPLRADEAREAAAQRAKSRGALAFALAFVAFIAAEWRRHGRTWWRRVAALVVPLAALAIVPLNAFSNASRLFDPTYFFSPVGGPYTASVGALGVTGALALLAGLAAARARWRVGPPLGAGAAAVVASVGAVPVLRDVASGITPPGASVPLVLWVGWEVALALLVTALLVVGYAAARGVLDRRQGLPPAVAIALAATAAAIGPSLWSTPAGWPLWYWVAWALAALAAAFTRRSTWGMAPAAVVAALCAAIVVWGTTAEKRVVLAERDLAGLSVPDPEAAALLERFGAQVAADGLPVDRADLLGRYARSDLAAADYPVRLALWSPAGAETAHLELARFDTDTAGVQAAVATARRRGAMVLTDVAGFPGVQLVLAVPGPRGAAMTAVVAPQTRLIPPDAFASLVGLAPDAGGTPPYAISLLEVAPGRFEGEPPPPDTEPVVGAGAAEASEAAASQAGAGHPPSGSPAESAAAAAAVAAPTPPGAVPIRWTRQGSNLHGDWRMPSSQGPARAHVDVALRPFDALVQRAVLLVVVDLLAVALLWALSVAGGGVLLRWARGHARRWLGSYRGQLTVVMFTFFVVPAALSAVWSYRRLRSDTAEERAVLVWQALRAAATGGLDALPADAERVGTPLLLYEDGMLSATSDSLYQALAPLGRFLRPDVELGLVRGNAVRASRTQSLGGVPVLFGYRAVDAPDGQRVVLAAPAPGDEVGLDARRTDLGILVCFTTVLGAAAALWLSGLVARQLARPIEGLRQAALALAGGEREPRLAGDPPTEFKPVFAAFRRMAADFGESQRVLAWGEMARQIAHEIKNPLTPIRLGVQHLQRARAAGRPDFDRILDQNAERILAEIDRLDRIARAFSRYGSAPAERPPGEPTELTAVVRDVVALERLGTGAPPSAGDAASARTSRGGPSPPAVDGGVAWVLSGDDRPTVVHARSDELREVLLNVLENARLARARRVTVTIEREGSDQESRGGSGTARALVVVDDDGDGIPADALPRIFEPHFSTRTSGSGLGLAVSRRIVESWGGTMAVESEPGRGTRVSIALVLRGA